MPLATARILVLYIIAAYFSVKLAVHLPRATHPKLRAWFVHDDWILCHPVAAFVNMVLDVYRIAWFRWLSSQ